MKVTVCQFNPAEDTLDQALSRGEAEAPAICDAR